MHFSSMVVSLLAESLPLAVAYRAGWRKREKPELLHEQSAFLQAALYEEFRDKKGVAVEKKREGATHLVQDKHGAVFEKKRSGTVRPVQGSLSSEIPSADRGASVECDPLSKAPDAGIFACGMDSHCVQSEESELGGFCVAFEQAPILSRATQWVYFNCTDGLDEYGATCDCSLFNNTSGYGSYTCTSPTGTCDPVYPTICGSRETTINITDNPFTLSYSVCLEPDGGVPAESLCYSFSSNLADFSTAECEFKINDVMCNSCSYMGFGCTTGYSGLTFDCTNTVVDVEGSTCVMGPFAPFFDVSTMPSESSAPMEEMPMPSTAPLETPSASPVEMPAATTSSAGSRSTKVAIMVSVCSAWLASFGA